ncbi:hypothetical protein IB276_05865 [Ensifer sp. ENS04]|uniref:hypothetical protein n=1 Tax=Ensifer sp. ENS04 TaxID=2769281 RepID=UPI00177E4229|nr:hypothetical protein [Ensifer sp. ENS04]MBD9538966.1 hypothetical protein [Ensifer sp. ENS04]
MGTANAIGAIGLPYDCDALEFAYFVVKTYGDTRMPSRHHRQVEQAVRDFVKSALFLPKESGISP